MSELLAGSAACRKDSLGGPSEVLQRPRHIDTSHLAHPYPPESAVCGERSLHNAREVDLGAQRERFYGPGDRFSLSNELWSGLARSEACLPSQVRPWKNQRDHARFKTEIESGQLDADEEN